MLQKPGAQVLPRLRISPASCGYQGLLGCMVVSRDSRVVPMEVAQELAAAGAALPRKAGQNRVAETGWACPVNL